MIHFSPKPTILRLTLLLGIGIGFISVSMSQETGDILSKFSLDVYLGPNVSIPFGGASSDLRSYIGDFKTRDFDQNSDFPYTVEGSVTGDAGIPPVFGAHFGANLAYALTENLFVKVGIGVRGTGSKWFTQQNYADNEFQYDEELFYQEKYSATVVDFPIQIELLTQNGGALFGGVSLGSANAARLVVRDNDIVWINTKRSDILSSESRVVTEYQNLEDTYAGVLLGGSIPLSESLHLRIEGNLLTSPLNRSSGYGNASVSICLGYRLSGSRFAQ